MSVSWCDKLKRSISTDSKWKASIYFHSSYASEINNQIALSSKVINEDARFTISQFPHELYNVNEFVDIVQLYNSSLTLLPGLLNEISANNNYPQNGIFHFEGYNDINDKDKLITDLKNAALHQDTVLINKRGYNVKESKTKYFTITLACSHVGHYRSSSSNNKEFLHDMLQQKNTIIQLHHHSSSVCGRSRSSTLKRAHCDDQESNMVKRSNTKQCNCSFQISIMFDHGTSRWFLKAKKSKSPDLLFHFNHIYIDPKHLNISHSSISPQVKDKILSLIQCGTPIPNIIHIVKQQDNVNVEYQTIYNMRLKQIDALINSLSRSDPSGPPVNKLISLFESIPNVSFVYVLHRYNSGFVTYRKQRNQSKTINLNSLNLSSSSHFCGSLASNWRQQLKLNHSNDILVAFAWCHDEEIRATEMFPEFLGADVTFGVNRQKRELLLVAGINDNNKDLLLLDVL